MHMELDRFKRGENSKVRVFQRLLEFISNKKLKEVTIKLPAKKNLSTPIYT